MAIDPNDITLRIVRLLADQSCYPQESIKPESNLESDLEMDSLDMIETIMAVEEEFEITVLDEEIETCKTVADIIALVSQKGGV